jgi:DNA repair exonuclease SbcCD ATPase subunit
MIVFETIRWKNFLSTGQQFTEVDLNESPSTLIVGNNGAGKSTILDALCFVLFNKPFRKITKPQLMNSVNERELLVEVQFKIGTISYKIVRGIKPTLFEIYRNQELVDQNAANKDYQKYLEQSVLKLNYKSFTQVVILGSSTFVPFMQLPAGHRREVIEDLLDIQIFSQMNGLLKERLKDAKDEQRQCEYELDMAQQKVDMQVRNINNLENVDKQHVENQQQKFVANEDRIVDINLRIKEVEKDISLIEPEILKLDLAVEKHEKFKDMKSKIYHKLNTSKKNYDFFVENQTCPTCTQEIDRELRISKQAELNQKCVELTDAGSQIMGQISSLSKNLKELREKASKVNEYRYEIQSLTKEERHLLKDNTSIMTEVGSDTSNLEKEKKDLETMTQALDKKVISCSNINKQTDHLKSVANLLKDGGIKTKIISKFIPLINQRINKYLQSMDFYVNFTLDDSFNEKILSRFRDDFSYASFSEGEKQKIDLALLFTWREVAALKNSVSTNLLLLDEVFDSSLDQSATDELMKILKGLGEKTNLFVISHKGDVLYDKFERIVEFSKEGDFSTMSAVQG